MSPEAPVDAPMNPTPEVPAGEVAQAPVVETVPEAVAPVSEAAPEVPQSPWAPPAVEAPVEAPAPIVLPPMPESLQPAAPVAPEAVAAANVIGTTPTPLENGKFGNGVVEAPMPPNPAKAPGWSDGQTPQV